ncbi:MAG: acyltransferase [Arenimonas sp.]|nr:acyltransferase [Arenimonas sp.]
MAAATGKTDYLAYLHGFRGIAILAIIGAHAWSVLGSYGAQENNPHYIWLYSATETLFHGSTLFFALISGILYSRVLRGKSWGTFFKNKGANVILPYVLLTILLTALSWPEYLAYGKANGITFFFPEELSKNIVFGQVQTHLWYIPVLTVLFLSTPLFALLLKPGRGIGLLLLGVMPLVVSRTPFPQLISWQTIAFFLGAYALGMVLGDRLEAMLTFVQRHLSALLVLLVAFSLANFLLFRWEYVATGFTSLHQSVVYSQKMLAAVLILYALHAHEDKLPKALMVLGTYAFSLYFLHFTFIWLLSEAFVKRLPDAGIPALTLAGLAIYALSILLSLLLSMGIRKLLGRYSRYLIGT